MELHILFQDVLPLLPDQFPGRRRGLVPAPLGQREAGLCRELDRKSVV